MITPPSDKKLFLVDAYALIFRAYYAFIKNPRINTKGMNTSAVFGFTNALMEVIRSEKPTHLAVVFDPPGPTLRTEQFEAYKANRRFMDEDLNRQFSGAAMAAAAAKCPDALSVEQKRAREIDSLLGPKFGGERTKPSMDFIVDLHTTTTNMHTHMCACSWIRWMVVLRDR